MKEYNIGDKVDMTPKEIEKVFASQFTKDLQIEKRPDLLTHLVKMFNT